MLGCKQQRQPKSFYSLVNLDERIRPDNPLREAIEKAKTVKSKNNT